MIIIRLAGGLGNQMFQYALGRHLAYKNQTDLKLDIFELKKNRLRDYQLKHLKIKGKVDQGLALRKIHWQAKSKTFLVKRFKKFSNLFKNIYLEKEKFKFDPQVFKQKKDIYLYGHWQSFKYFEDIKEIIKKDFSFKEKLNKKNKQVLEKIINSNSVALHIRRSDYLTDKQAKKFHDLCSMRYYYIALEKIKREVKKPHFFIFSDDIKWARKNLRFKNQLDFINVNSIKQGYKDLRLMKNCKHFIIANSTFSWWSAWLSENKKKIIVAPKKWLKTERKVYDLLPKEWLKL